MTNRQIAAYPHLSVPSSSTLGEGRLPVVFRSTKASDSFLADIKKLGREPGVKEGL